LDALHGWPLMLEYLFWFALGFFVVIMARLFTETL
jgi:hypothetical protein